MKNLTFHIVGLTHNDVKGHEVEYAKEAEGRTICLVPDDANTFDMLAVKAYDKQQLIGYVSALEGEDVRALIIARKERNLRTRCIGCNSKNEGDKAGLQLMVRALSDVSDEEMEQARREIKHPRLFGKLCRTAPSHCISFLPQSRSGCICFANLHLSLDCSFRTCCNLCLTLLHRFCQERPTRRCYFAGFRL